MTRKKQRALFLGLGLAILGAAVALVTSALEDSLTFFYGPSELQTQNVSPQQRLRLGGLVEPGSLHRNGEVVSFLVTDGKAELAVHYAGVLPDLFREGQGVVAEGHLQKQGVFRADTILAKHDEKYMPPDVADVLKDHDEWRAKQASQASLSQAKGQMQ